MKTSAAKKRRTSLSLHPDVRARPGSGFTDDDIREAWEILTEMAGGPSWPMPLTPKHVLDAVLADPHHPLRRHLELNVEKAAYAHWLTQIRRLLNEVRVSVIVERGPAREGFAKVRFARALHPMPATKTRGPGFLPISEIKKQESGVGVLARSRVSYLRQWIAATENIVLAIESPSETDALTEALDACKRAVAAFDKRMTKLIDEAAE